MGVFPESHTKGGNFLRDCDGCEGGGDGGYGYGYGGGDDMIMRNSQCHPLSSVAISSFHSLSIHLLFSSPPKLSRQGKKNCREIVRCVVALRPARAGGGSTTVSDELTLLATADRGRY